MLPIPPASLRALAAAGCAWLLVGAAPASAQDAELRRMVEEQERIIEEQDSRIQRLEAVVKELMGARAAQPEETMEPGVADMTLPTGQEYSLDLDELFTDEDSGALTYSVSGVPPWMSLDRMTGILSGTPPSPAPPVTVTVTAMDAGGLTVTEDFTVTVSTNQPPVFRDTPGGLEVAENVTGNFGPPLAATDPEGGAVTFSLKSDHFAVSGDGQLSVKDAAVMDHESTSTYLLRVTAADPEGASTTQTVQVTVTDVNEAPRVAVIIPKGLGGPFGGGGKYDPEKGFFGPTGRLVSKDGRFSTGVNGFVQVDAGGFSSKGFNGRDFEAGSRVRRAQLNFSSVIDRNWIVFLAYDLADGSDATRKGIRAAAAIYRGLSPWWFAAGAFGGGIGLESSTFSTALSMPERPMMSNAFAYAPGGTLLTVGATHRGRQHYARLGLYGKGLDVSGQSDEGWGIHGRFLWQPLKARGRSAHIGLSGYWRQPNEENLPADRDDPSTANVNERATALADDGFDFCSPDNAKGSSVRFDAFGTSSVDGSNIVDTGKFCDVEDYSYVSLEGIATFGSLAFQGEWGQARINGKQGAESYKFDGGYIQGSYFLTGESKNYNSYFAQFWRVAPKKSLSQGGFGAWEVIARWQTINLNDKDVKGGKASGYTVGLNWYLNPFVKALLSYGDLEVEGTGTIAGGGDAALGDGDLNEYLLRVQMEF